MKLYRFEKSESKRIDALRDRKIWMPLPKTFNDPFDCNLPIRFDGDNNALGIDNIFEAIKILYKRYDPSKGDWLISKDVHAGIMRWVESKGDTDMWHLVGLIKKQAYSYGVQCFCQEGLENPLMWAHYGDNHKGFCIEYDYDPWVLALNNNGLFTLIPVMYGSEIQNLDLVEILASPRMAGSKLTAFKLSEWAYEKEMRLLYHPFSERDSNPDFIGELVDMPQGLNISAIYLGANISKENGERLESIASDLKIDLKAVGVDKTRLSPYSIPMTK